MNADGVSNNAARCDVSNDGTASSTIVNVVCQSVADVVESTSVENEPVLLNSSVPDDTLIHHDKSDKMEDSPVADQGSATLELGNDHAPDALDSSATQPSRPLEMHLASFNAMSEPPANAQSYLVDVDTLRNVLEFFWVPFFQSHALPLTPTHVPLSCVKSQASERWREFAKCYGTPCCSHAADLIRLSAIGFGVWKVVSTSKKDLSRYAALYNPNFVNMSAWFTYRLTTLVKMLATPHSHSKWTDLVLRANTSVRRRNLELMWTRCADSCSKASYRGFHGAVVPLHEWGAMLVNE